MDKALTLSGVQMEKVLEAVDAALDTALGGTRPPPGALLRFTYMTLDKSNQFERERFEIGRRLGKSVATFSSNDVKPPWGIRELSAPVPGRYRIRVKANAYQSRGQPVAFQITSGFFFLLNGAPVQLVGYYSVPAGNQTVIEAEG